MMDKKSFLSIFYFAGKNQKFPLLKDYMQFTIHMPFTLSGVRTLFARTQSRWRCDTIPCGRYDGKDFICKHLNSLI